MKYSALRKKHGLTCRQLANSLRSEFPAVSISGISQAERSDETGIRFTPDAAKAIRKLYGLPESSVSPGRKDQSRLFCWLSEPVRDLFNTQKALHGFDTDKAYVVWLILNDQIKKAAPESPTPKQHNDDCISTQQ